MRPIPQQVVGRATHDHKVHSHAAGWHDDSTDILPFLARVLVIEASRGCHRAANLIRTRFCASARATCGLVCARPPSYFYRHSALFRASSRRLPAGTVPSSLCHRIRFLAVCSGTFSVIMAPQRRRLGRRFLPRRRTGGCRRLFGCAWLTRGNFSGRSMDSTERSMSRSGQYK